MQFMKNISLQVLIAILLLAILGQYLIYIALNNSMLREAGPAGDFISGTVGPIINLLAAFLVYLSFREQLRMNKMQTGQIQSQANERRQEEMERRFYFLLEQYNLNLNVIDYAGRTGKTAIPMFLSEFEILLNALLSSYRSNYRISATEDISPSEYYKLVSLTFELWLTGLTQGSERALLKQVLKNSNVPAQRLSRLEDLKDGEELHQAFPEFLNLINITRLKSPMLVDNFQVQGVFTPRYGHLTAYFKVVYQVLNYVNELEETIFPYSRKKELVDFFKNLLSPSELYLLAYAGLSSELSGLEIQSRQHFLGPKKFDLDSKESRNWINRMFVSKYDLFDEVFMRYGSKASMLSAVYGNPFVGGLEVNPNDTQWELYKREWFEVVWNKI